MTAGSIYSNHTFLIFVLWALFVFSGCAAVDTAEKDTELELAEKWGVEITGVRLAAAGHMIDFRYRVLEPDKAMPLLSRDSKAYLIDQKSEKVLSVPSTAKVGPLRTTGKPEKGRIYWMFFGNTPGFIQSGSKVTVVIGDFRVEDLVVQ